MMRVMNTVTIQVSVPKQIAKQGEVVASEWGFRSLEDAAKVFITSFVKKTFVPSFQGQEEIRLSKKSKIRYQKIAKDIKENRNLMVADNADELFKQLEQEK